MLLLRLLPASLTRSPESQLQLSRFKISFLWLLLCPPPSEPPPELAPRFSSLTFLRDIKQVALIISRMTDHSSFLLLFHISPLYALWTWGQAAWCSWSCWQWRSCRTGRHCGPTQNRLQPYEKRGLNHNLGPFYSKPWWNCFTCAQAFGGRKTCGGTCGGSSLHPSPE